jgi:tetratricopeptide (TPR) repeat protein
MERYAEARPEAEALAASPYALIEPDVFMEAGLAFASSGDLDAAIARVRRYSELRPDDAAGWFVLGEYHRLAGDAAKAAEAAENQRRSRRNAAISRHAEALRAERLDQRRSAIVLLEEAVQIDPDYTAAAADLRRLRAR